MVRRRFLQWGVFSSVVSNLPQEAFAKKNNKLNPPNFRKDRLSILQGATDESHTQFSVLHPNDEDHSFRVKSANDIIYPDHIEVITHGDHDFAISKPYFSGLSLGVDYSLEVIGKKSKVLDQRKFKTLSGDLSTVRFAIASCMDEARHKPKIWRDMIKKQPDAIFFVGDSVYADRRRSSDARVTASPDLLWRRFCDARRTLEIYHDDRLIPIFATWDDHDFGKNDTGKTYPYVYESQKNFLSFFAQEESHCRMLVRGPGVSSSLTIGDHLFLLLDDRSFRESGKSNKRHAHWGKEQENWALEQIDDHKGFVWIANGTQIFPTMIFKESVSGDHPNQLEGFMDELQKRGTRCAFLSGDVHFSEISQIEKSWLGYTTYEFTSSAIHSKTVPGAPGIIPNKRRVVATAKKNYLLLEATDKPDHLKVVATSHSKNERVNFKKTFKIFGR